MSEAALEERLYGRAAAAGASRAEPNSRWMHAELKRPGMTLELLHLEYLAEHPNGLRYTAFGQRYRRWKRARPIYLTRRCGVLG